MYIYCNNSELLLLVYLAFACLCQCCDQTPGARGRWVALHAGLCRMKAHFSLKRFSISNGGQDKRKKGRLLSNLEQLFR